MENTPDSPCEVFKWQLHLRCNSAKPTMVLKEDSTIFCYFFITIYLDPSSAASSPVMLHGVSQKLKISVSFTVITCCR